MKAVSTVTLIYDGKGTFAALLVSKQKCCSRDANEGDDLQMPGPVVVLMRLPVPPPPPGPGQEPPDVRRA